MAPRPNAPSQHTAPAANRLRGSGYGNHGWRGIVVGSMRRRHLGSLGIGLLIPVLAGCTGGGGILSPGSNAGASGRLSPSPTPAGSATEPASPVSYATGSTDVVVRIDSGGGLVSPVQRLIEMPLVSLYGDGRIVIARWPRGDPTPILRSITTATISPKGIQRILAAADAAGLLGPDRRYDNPGITDLQWTAFTVTADRKRHVTSAYALGVDYESPALSDAERAARRRLLDFDKALDTLTMWLGPDVTQPERPWTIETMSVYVAAQPPQQDAPSGQDLRQWPLATPPDVFGKPLESEYPGESWRCATVSGNELVRLDLGTATWLTRWTSAGQLYRMAARPVLPDETGCPGTL